MRALVQRVSRASVSVDAKTVGEIRRGLLVFLGIREGDAEDNAAKLAKKVINLRIFPDGNGKMNLSLRDVCGELLVVSQFTLYGDTTGGNRPSYSAAAKPETAKLLYELFVQFCKDQQVTVATGVFQAHMEVALVNDGPITLICHSEN
ncbi:MAG: D-tyrosyl-tRNA(Tyr) deacylase [Acidobacteriaceae bacterium]|nr:D-tyrosyl-tRNA(Tyr) deacylase [Acidobacteriaceae bacterium]MBV9679900.1 D-tyrosyl-tRNA(Tyr) deacylase [Acidobacteriaceae bacterium]MBV9937380.1 D-tyrosyl-tRNA(Tyr) deacylase [Acidobacteriaceae bacterium]